MFLLRGIGFFILVSLLTILGYPLIILYNLANGGDGFGLCEDIVTCSIPISEGPRLLIFLISTFFFLVFLLRLIMKYINSLQENNSIL